MEPPVVRAYSSETIVAEKFEASLELAELNSRMKDFYDIWMLSRAYQFHGPTLQGAVVATCERRATPLTSRALIFSKEFAASTEKRAQWAAFLRKAPLARHIGRFSDDHGWDRGIPSSRRRGERKPAAV